MIRRKSASAEVKTILLVDDDGALLEVQEILLSEMGYKVVTAKSAEAALVVLKKDADIDLLVTDFGLPGMNGRQLADTARTLRPTLPVLFVTGAANPTHLDPATLPQGMVLFIKPAPIEEFYAALEKILPAEKIA